MADIPVGTYPYHKRHAIMEAVQAGLLPHTRLDGDEGHQGCVTVIVRVVPPSPITTTTGAVGLFEGATANPVAGACPKCHRPDPVAGHTGFSMRLPLAPGDVP